MLGQVLFSPPFKYLETGISLETNPNCAQILKQALEQANKGLQDVKVVCQTPLPEDIKKDSNLSLVIQTEEVEHPIDWINLKALDEKSIKPADVLAKEMIHKVNQHLAAKKSKDIFFASTGAKYDISRLSKHTFSIDSDGYLKIDNHFVLYGEMKIKAEQLHSYSILRLVDEREGIRIFDEYDLVRTNNKGMFINPNKEYNFLERDELTPQMKQELRNHFEK